MFRRRTGVQNQSPGTPIPAGVALALLPAFASHAQPGPPADPEPPAEPRLLARHEGLVPGAVNTLAITFEIDEGWHVYWPGQNDTGYPVSAGFTLPEGYEAGDPAWPAAHRHVSPGGILDYVYEDGEATLLIPLTVPASAEPGERVTIRADVEWLVCREACIPGWATVELTLPVLEAGVPPRPGPGAGIVGSASARLPKPLPENSEDINLRWQRGTLVIEAKRPASALAFLPHENGRVLRRALETGASRGEPLRLRFEEGEEPVAGVVTLTPADGSDPLHFQIESRPPGEEARGEGG